MFVKFDSRFLVKVASVFLFEARAFFQISQLKNVASLVLLRAERLLFRFSLAFSCFAEGFERFFSFFLRLDQIFFFLRIFLFRFFFPF